MTTPPEIQTLIDAVVRADTADGLLEATEALAATGHPDSAPCLLEILGFNNPGAAVAAVDGLIAIGEPVVETILNNLDGYNYGARAWSVRALAGIGDRRGLAVLERALAADIGPSVRRAAACGLGTLNLSDPSEAEQERERCLHGLIQAGADGEWIVRYAVTVGLERRLREPACPEPLRTTGQRALQTLADDDQEDVKVVRLRAQLALQRLNAG
ncbi:MAG: HEAT repeat domain-containing protein [Synechococcus sp.]